MPPLPRIPVKTRNMRDAPWRGPEWKVKEAVASDVQELLSVDNQKNHGGPVIAGPEIQTLNEESPNYERNHSDASSLEQFSDSAQLDTYDPNDRNIVDIKVSDTEERYDSTAFAQTNILRKLEAPLDLAETAGSSRIHVLGLGPTGRFVAHALAALGERPAVSLLFNRKDASQTWKKEGQLLEVIHGMSSDVQGGFDFESLLPTWSSASEIAMLVVTTKASQTVRLLRKLEHRLGPESTICFLHNAMGVMEEVNSKVFPDVSSRPRYLCGVSSHLLIPSKRSFTTEQKNIGEIFLSLVPQEIMQSERPFGPSSEGGVPVRRIRYKWTTSSRKLLRNLTRSLHLKAKGLQYRDLLEIQLEKLAIAAVIEPLCVVFDCACGDLLDNFAVTRLVRGLLRELTQVIRALPEFAECEVLHIDEHFSMKRLEYLIFQYAMASRLHVPTMLQEIRKGGRSEVEYLNGYILKRAQELGIDCPINNMVVQMVKAKEAISCRQLGNYVPWEGS